MPEAGPTIVGLFGSPEELLAGIRALRKQGLEPLDACTPYPVHGLAEALGLRRSPLGGMVMVMGVLGALVAWFVQRSSRDGDLVKARHEKGTLVASGFIAGGALVGVLAALLKFIEDSAHVTLVPDITRWGGFGAWAGAWSNWAGLTVFVLLAIGLYLDARREKLEA